MLEYPSILFCPSSGSGVKLHTFDKIDGSNLRFEWTRKRGWFKFGTRRRLFDKTDAMFGSAIGLFYTVLAEPIERVARKERWESVVAFAEFWGDGSFAGVHTDDSAKFLTLIDVAPCKRGILAPVEFLRRFEGLSPNYLGYMNWGPDFLQRVCDSRVEGITLEGVVGKANGKNGSILMYKYKTQKWRDEVKKRYSGEEAEKIIAS